MNLKLVVAICALAATPAFAQQPPPAGPKVTKADAQKVAQTISSDKAKLAAFCTLMGIDAQIQAALAKNDRKTADDLNTQGQAAVQKIPEYDALMRGTPPDPRADKAGADEFVAALDSLAKQCPAK